MKYREMAMGEKRKRKRDLYATFQHIERYHQRRAIFTMHIIFSLAFQVTMWVNWYASYARQEVLFRDDLFSPRIIISLVLGIFLIGHYSMMNLAGEKDRMVIEALRQHEEEVDSYSDDEDHE
jgi:hypothetical protein